MEKRKEVPGNAIQRLVDASPSLRSQAGDVTNEVAQATAEMAVGNLYIRDTGDLLRIRQIKEVLMSEIVERTTDGGKSWRRKNDVFINNEGQEVLYHVLTDTKWYSKHRWKPDANGWCQDDENYCSYSRGFAQEYGNARLLKTVEEYEAELQDFIATQDYSPYAPAQAKDDDENEGQELLHVGSKAHLVAVTTAMQAQRNHVTVMQRLLRGEMEKRKNMLEIMRSQMLGIVADFQKKLQRMYRVIQTIELYLGIDEDIIQLQAGEPAPVNTPISFRQQITYMDEEMGIVGDDKPHRDGIDFNDVPLFDAWLIENQNYKQLLPEEKGVSVCRVRRYDKVYVMGDSYEARMTNELMNVENHKTYVLIRNGENIYKIWADINIEPRLFPRREELQQILSDAENGPRGRGYRSDEEKKDDYEKAMHQYKARAAMMQGLIDRTEILHPLPQPINLFRLDDAQHLVNFIHDDEATLPSGRLSFKQWHAHINAQIERGSRIILSGRWSEGGGYYSNEDFKDRFLRYYENKWSIPSLPRAGLYTVETIKGKEIEFGLYEHHGNPNDLRETPIRRHIKLVVGDDGKPKVVRTAPRLFVQYNPKDEVRNGWADYDGHTRKNNISFEVFPDDSFVLNYDQISLDDIDFYLNCRLDRKNYLDILPLLRHLKTRRLNELQWERDFVLLVQGELLKSLGNKVAGVDTEAVIWEAVEWWKHKVIWKRPITKDDAKALRMIKDRVAKRFT